MDRAEEDERGKAFVGLVVAGCDASELFEITEEVLNEMSPAIHGEITRDELLAIRFRRDDSLGMRFGERLTQPIVVEPLVGQQRRHIDVFDQAGCCDAVVALSGKQDETGKISQPVDESDDLCCQSAARSSDSLMTRPPFAPMPC